MSHVKELKASTEPAVTRKIHPAQERPLIVEKSTRSPMTRPTKVSAMPPLSNSYVVSAKESAGFGRRAEKKLVVAQIVAEMRIMRLQKTTSPSVPETGRVPPGRSIHPIPTSPTTTPTSVSRAGRSPVITRQITIVRGVEATMSAITPVGT